jgi:N-acetylmuramoyl-L-alanine amidase-like protein
MTYSIDKITYDKARAYPIGHGYLTRPVAPTAIVVHSTEGAPGQTLESAATYLYNSADVSSDFLIGKAGEIIQFLDSHSYQAWHAGGQQPNGSWTAQPAYSNPHSIGIECLHVQGESWPAVQKDALAWLLDYLTALYHIPVLSIETHGQIAIAGPYDRKHDPTNWPHADFIAWRDSVLAPAPAYRPYQVIAPCAVFTSRSPNAPLAGGPDSGQTWLAPGDIINMGHEQDGWLWVSDSPTTEPGIGFIPASYARPV